MTRKYLKSLKIKKIITKPLESTLLVCVMVPIEIISGNYPWYNYPAFYSALSIIQDFITWRHEEGDPKPPRENPVT